MKTDKIVQLKAELLSRYGVAIDNANDWKELHLTGGIATSRADFQSLAEAAKEYGDLRVILYEMESLGVSYKPYCTDLSYDSFLKLRGSTISHFELAMIPSSVKWAALLTNDFETFVFGPPEFLAKVSGIRG